MEARRDFVPTFSRSQLSLKVHSNGEWSRKISSSASVKSLPHGTVIASSLSLPIIVPSSLLPRNCNMIYKKRLSMEYRVGTISRLR